MKTIKLQSIGTVNAIEAQDLKIGDVTIWNFGGLETIISVVSETACFITFKIRCEETGNLHERRLKKTRLVGFKKPAKKEKVKVTYAQVKKALAKGWKSPLNNRNGAFQAPTYKIIAPAVAAITGAEISNAANKAMKQNSHVELFENKGVCITLRDNKESGLTLSLFNAESSALTQYVKVTGIDDTKQHIKEFAKTINF